MILTTEINNSLDDQEVKFLIEDYSYGRYFEDKDFPIASSNTILASQIKDFGKGASARYIKVYSDDQISGVLLFKLSEWDTNHFGFPIVIIDSILIKETDYNLRIKFASELLEKLDIWLRSNNVRFLSARLPAMDLAVIHSFENAGFDFIESWVYNKYDLKNNIFEKPPATLRFAKPEDKETMIRFSKGAFSTQRFHADCRFDSTKADSLYEKWILTAFDDPNQLIAVLDIDGKAAAYMIYFKKDLSKDGGPKFAMWKFAVIDTTLRGKGLGASFFDSLKQHHQNEGLDVIDSGVSLRNLHSMNLHNKCGFKLVATIVTFHKWLN